MSPGRLGKEHCLLTAAAACTAEPFAQRATCPERPCLPVIDGLHTTHCCLACYPSLQFPGSQRDGGSGAADAAAPKRTRLRQRPQVRAVPAALGDSTDDGSLCLLTLHCDTILGLISMRRPSRSPTLGSEQTRPSCLLRLLCSLGGALATLCALDLKLNQGAHDVRLYTYGSPRVGNSVFADWFESQIKVRGCSRTQD